MDALLTSLTEALHGGWLLAVCASALWGVASILLSPCHLTSIPLIIGYLSSQHEQRMSRGGLLSLVFALGILVTIAALGLVTAAMGRMMGDVGSWGRYAVAAVFIAVGLYLMDVIRVPDGGMALRPVRSRSAFWSAFVLGLVFGIALGPCTFAFMAPVLGVVFQLSDTTAAGAGLLLAAFGVGHCSVIVLAGAVGTRIQAYLDWTNRSHLVRRIRKAAGLLVLLGGMYSIYAG